MSRFDTTTSERLVSRVVRHEPVRAQSVDPPAVGANGLVSDSAYPFCGVELD